MGLGTQIKLGKRKRGLMLTDNISNYIDYHEVVVTQHKSYLMDMNNGTTETRD